MRIAKSISFRIVETKIKIELLFGAKSNNFDLTSLALKRQQKKFFNFTKVILYYNLFLMCKTYNRH